MFEHLINKCKITCATRILSKPCLFIEKLVDFFNIYSVMLKSVCSILREKYQVDSIDENDIDAILSRIQYVQNHESQMRESW